MMIYIYIYTHTYLYIYILHLNLDLDLHVYTTFDSHCPSSSQHSPGMAICRRQRKVFETLQVENPTSRNGSQKWGGHYSIVHVYIYIYIHTYTCTCTLYIYIHAHVFTYTYLGTCIFSDFEHCYPSIILVLVHNGRRRRALLFKFAR